MKLQILIPTTPLRQEKFQRLVDCLKPQLTKDVEVLVRYNNFEMTIGELREDMVKSVTAEYMCFIDDDDLVPEYYIEKILPLLDGVDYVGFRMQMGNETRIFHSLRWDGWYENGDGYFRKVTYLNPIKTKIAKQFKNDPENMEDRSWHDQLSPRTKTEHYIEEIMYYYLQGESVWNRTEQADYKKPIKLPKGFKYI